VRNTQQVIKGYVLQRAAYEPNHRVREGVNNEFGAPREASAHLETMLARPHSEIDRPSITKAADAFTVEVNRIAHEAVANAILASDANYGVRRFPPHERMTPCGLRG
jgi:hypothetical protein